MATQTLAVVTAGEPRSGHAPWQISNTFGDLVTSVPMTISQSPEMMVSGD